MVTHALIQQALYSNAPSSMLIKSLCRRSTQHIFPSASGLKRTSFVRHLSRVSAAWREVIGIDFGTTNCRAAVMDKDGNPKMIEISDRKICMPSVVSFDQNGKASVGTHPKDAISDQTVFGIKRMIGRSYDELDETELGKLKKMVPYEIIRPDSDEEEEARIKLTNGKKYTPTYIASLIIDKLIDETAKCRGNIHASHAVVSVPAFFDEARSFALRKAAKRRNPYVTVDVIYESVAASLYYMTKSNRKRGRFAVIDLGGGSFDISVVNASNERWGPDIKIIATKHVDSVAGVDLDHAMMDLLLKRLEQETGGKIHQLGLSYHSAAVRRESERTKIEFFSSTALHSRPINLDIIRCVQGFGDDQLETCLERSEFEDSMKKFEDSIKDLCWSCLKEANMGPKQVDEVILVGGMSRVPRVWELVKEIFGKRPVEEVNPDEAVALGAAIKANLIANKNEN